MALAATQSATTAGRRPPIDPETAERTYRMASPRLVNAASGLDAEGVRVLLGRLHRLKKQIAGHADITISPMLAARHVRNSTRQQAGSR